jgi:hypothetical protein
MRFFLKILFLSLFVMVSTITKAQKFDRGLSLSDGPVFMPKGQLMFGGTISYQDYKFYDFDFLILNQININAYTLKVTPNIYYSFAKNMAVGVRFTYQRTLGRIDEVDLSLSEDLNFSISDFYSLQHTYNGSLSYRYYMPLGQSTRFGLFSDIMLNFGMGQGKILSGKGDEVSGVFQEILQLGIDVVPGVVVFMTNEVSVEASVGILGLTYKKIKQTKNQIYEGSYESSAAKFKINLLTIGIGVNFVIPIIK